MIFNMHYELCGTCLNLCFYNIGSIPTVSLSRLSTIKTNLSCPQHKPNIHGPRTRFIHNFSLIDVLRHYLISMLRSLGIQEVVCHHVHFAIKLY